LSWKYHIHFYPNLPLGVNKIKELMAAGAKILGLPDSFRPHSLHAVGVTKLANDSSISIAEVSRATCHSTASASKMYQKTDGIFVHLASPCLLNLFPLVLQKQEELLK
jgi:hypothetical protein